MTYPYPQGGYNPQDPYNQGGGYPQSGGFPAQGGYNPQDPYNQGGGYPQTGGFPQQPGGGYPPPPPPKKSNTALIVSIVAVVVLALGALGITGFVAPGFFLSSDKKSDDGGEGDTGTGPEALAQAIVAGLNAKDPNALNSIKCADATPSVLDVIEDVDGVQNAQLAGQVRKESDIKATADVSFVAETPTGNETGTATGVMANQNGKWCWQDVHLGGGTSTPSSAPSIESQSAPPVDPSGGSTGGTVTGSFQTVMDDFKSKVNSGDAAGAKAMACSANSTSVSSTVDTATSGSASVSLTGSPTGSDTSNMLYDLTGTLNGSSAQGLLGVNSTDGGSTWCVDYFSFY